MLSSIQRCSSDRQFYVWKPPTGNQIYARVFVHRPPLPHHKQIWDVSAVLRYLNSSGDNTKLSLQDLTMKRTMLIALVTG